MALIKLGDVQIDGEDLGFPVEVLPTETQIGVKVAELIAKNAELSKDVIWQRNEAEKHQAKVKSLLANEKKIREMECDAFLNDAARSFKIDSAEIPFLKQMWTLNPNAVRDHIDKLRIKNYLKEEQGISGATAGPDDPVAEVMAKKGEVIANNKDISDGDAMLEVLRRDPALSARYRSAMLTGSKEGER